MIACDICKEEITHESPKGSYNTLALALVPVEVNTYGYNIKTDVMYTEDASLTGLSSFIHRGCLDKLQLLDELATKHFPHTNYEVKGFDAVEVD